MQSLPLLVFHKQASTVWWIRHNFKIVDTISASHSRNQRFVSAWSPFYRNPFEFVVYSLIIPESTNHRQVRIVNLFLEFLFRKHWPRLRGERKRLRRSRGSVVAFCTKFRGFKDGRSLRIFQGEKNPQHTLLGGEVKKPVPCRIFAACKRTLKVALTRYLQAKFTGHFTSNSSTFHC
jgi:hypothetical protein